MTTTTDSIPNATTKQIAVSFLNALNDENFETARECVNDDMVFEGVLGQRNGAEAYFKDMEKMRLKYEIIKVFEDGNDVCVLCNVIMAVPAFTCIWYQFQHNKIKFIKAVFDPRPVLEKQDKK